MNHHFIKILIWISHELKLQNILSSLIMGCALLTGWFEDITGSWLLSFHFAGTLSLLAGILVLVEPLISKCWCCHLSNKELSLGNTEEEDKIIGTDKV